MRPFRLLASAVLTVGAVVGAACLLMALSALLLGIRPVVFRTGSMAPTAPSGSLGISHRVAAGDLRVGDVVTVPYHGTRVTHRIVEVTHGSDDATLRLKGDGNNAPDPAVYRVTSAARLWFAVPALGGVIAWLSTAPGVYVLVLYLALMLALAVRPGPERPNGGRRRRDPPSGHRGRRNRGRRAQRAVATAAAAMAVLAGPGGPAFAAPWADAAPVSGTRLTAGTVPPSASFNCGILGVLSVTFVWTAVPGATSYTLHYGSGGSSTAVVSGTSATVLAVIAGGTAWVQANHDYGSVTWTSAPSNTRTYTVAAVSLCG